MASTLRSVAFALLTILPVAGGVRAQGAAPELACTAPDLARRAGEHVRAERWAEAVDAYRELVAINPYEGAYPFDLGLALLRTGRCDEAIAAWQSAQRLGFQPANCAYDIACAHAVAGREAEAIDWIGRALEQGFLDDAFFRTDPDLAAIRPDPRFRELVGVFPPEGLSRDERWRWDLRFFARRMEQIHWDLYAKVRREDFAAAVAALDARIPGLDDAALRLELQRIAASVGDGHTAVDLASGPEASPLLPLDLWLFPEGLFVRGASKECAELVGGRVVRLGALDVEAALAAVAPLCSTDNAMGVRLQGPRLLVRADVLRAIGAASAIGPVDVRVETAAGPRTASVAPVPRPVWLHGHAPRVRPDFAHANAAADQPPPPDLRDPQRRFLILPMPESGILYARLDAILDQPPETLAGFAGRVAGAVEASDLRALVLDLRHNGGGNTGLFRPLLHALIGSRVDVRGRLFVIVGRETFSAAMNAASLIEANTQALFVGEPTGSSPNFVGESTRFTLPCSGVQVSCSSRYWQFVTSTDQRTWIAPDLPAEASFADYAANRDPALAVVIARLACHPEPKASAAEAAAGGSERR